MKKIEKLYNIIMKTLHILPLIGQGIYYFFNALLTITVLCILFGIFVVPFVLIKIVWGLKIALLSYGVVAIISVLGCWAHWGVQFLKEKNKGRNQNAQR